jgi:hypothetical protein
MQKYQGLGIYEIIFLLKTCGISPQNYGLGPRRLAHGSTDPSLNVGRSTPDRRTRLEHEGVCFPYRRTEG